MGDIFWESHTLCKTVHIVHNTKTKRSLPVYTSNIANMGEQFYNSQQVCDPKDIPQRYQRYQRYQR